MRRVKRLFRGDNVWWRYAQHFVIALVGRCIETIDMYMAHVCFYVCFSDCLGMFVV